ncbi:polysaccharide biosynthesis protein|nr:polysaccharide biosynthesis protein [Candidatus Pantoea persica]
MKLSVMSNAAWMMSEKIVSVFGVIFVTSYVAKSFGPSVFGQMTFSTSFIFNGTDRCHLRYRNHLV